MLIEELSLFNANYQPPVTMSTTMPTSMPISDSVLEKASLTIPKLQGHDDWCRWSTTMQIALDHTWEYVAGAKKHAPESSDPQLPNWVIEDRNACQRIWLALSK